MRPISVLAATAIVVAIAVVAGYWFFTYYDTAVGKCNRGDLGACTVVSAQQAAREREAQAIIDAQAEAARQQALASAIAAAPATGDQCNLGLDGLEMVAVVYPPLTCAVFASYVTAPGGATWVYPLIDPGSGDLVCTATVAGATVMVTDVGGKYYGGLLCQSLHGS